LAALVLALSVMRVLVSLLVIQLEAKFAALVLLLSEAKLSELVLSAALVLVSLLGI
jgi:hypothetical protein